MDKDDKIAAAVAVRERQSSRRAFLTTAAKVAVTAPAVTMLLAAPTKSYAGLLPSYGSTEQTLE